MEIEEECSIQPQNSSLGIYIEELANLRIYNTEWILVTKIDLNFYRSEFFKLVELYENLEHRCDLIVKKYYTTLEGYSVPYCKAPLQQIQNMMDESKRLSADWFIKREKRNVLSVLGGALLGGFGYHLLSSLQTDEYLAEFEAMNAQNKHRDMIISKQTSLLEYAFDEIESMNETFAFQLNNIESRLVKFDSILKSINVNLDHQTKLNNIISARIDFSMILNHFSLILTQFRDRQKQFLDTVSITHKNPSNPNIIPPKVLFEELINIKNAISSLELDLPFSVSRESLSLFYQIATPRARIEKDVLIIDISIPLIKTKKYVLYKGTSMPYRIRDNLFSYIVPHHEYIALDTFFEKYVAITNDEISNCFHVNSSNIICKQTFPILSAYHTQTCEINLLRSLNVSFECNIRVANLTSELWIKLRKPNTYIYAFPPNQMLQVDCPNNKVKQFYNGSGIISFTSGCTVKTEDIEIQAFQSIQSEILNEFIPSVKINTNISNDVIEMLKFPEINIPNVNIPNIIGYGEKRRLENKSRAFDELKTLEKSLQEQTTPVHFKKDISKLSMFSFTMLLFILFLILRMCYKKWSLRRKPKIPFLPPLKTIQHRNVANIPNRELTSINSNPNFTKPQQSNYIPMTKIEENKPLPSTRFQLLKPMGGSETSIFDLPNDQ